MGVECGHLRADGRLGRGLGARLCVNQFDAAGAAGGRRATPGAGVGLAQYIGALCWSAVGSAIGGLLFARDLPHDMGYASAGLVALALTMVLLSRPRRGFSA